MKALLQWTTLITLAIGLPAAAVAGNGSGVNGTWKGAFDFQGNSIPVTLNLKSDGATLTGTVEGLPTTPAEIHDGSLAGDTVTFWLNSDYEGQTYKIVYKGKVDGDQIVFDFGTEDGSWSSPLTVKRADPDTGSAPGAASPAAAPTAPSADVDGDWKGSFDFEGNQVPVTFHLKKSADAVTGTIDGLGSAPTDVHEGKVEGDTVTFWVNTDYEGQTYTLMYKGKVAPRQIDFTFGTVDGTWSSSVMAKKGS